MRAPLLLVLLLAAAWSGCAEAPGPSEPIPVVRTTSVLNRTTASGEPWTPSPYGGPHGCPDAFSVDAAAHRVEVTEHAAPENRSQAAALVIVGPRNPDARPSNSLLRVPATLPHTEAFEDHVLRVDEGGVRLDGEPLAPGERRTLTLTYERDVQGERVHVRESLTVEHLGLWQDPIRLRPTQWCV